MDSPTSASGSQELYSAAARLPMLRQEILQDEHEVILNLEIPENLLYCEGHFPEKKIVPGFVLIAWALHYAAENFEFKKGCNRVQRVKFLQPIEPRMQVRLTVERKKEARLIFSYQDDEREYCRGEASFR